MYNLRIGTGFDVHRFQEGRGLYLGGVQIPFKKGLKGHSDADILIHAICDALLGALGEGDIGVHFPDSDQKYKDKRSTFFLGYISEMIEGKNWEIVNIDSIVIAEEPRIAGYAKEMKEIIANHLRIEPQQISIKGTTTEGLGFTGKKEGMACFATALISRK